MNRIKYLKKKPKTKKHVFKNQLKMEKIKVTKILKILKHLKNEFNNLINTVRKYLY